MSILLLLLLLLLAAAVRHRTPATRGVLHTNSSIFYYGRRYFSTPLGSTVAFVRPGLTPILHLAPLLAIMGYLVFV